MSFPPGAIRDAIIEYLTVVASGATTEEIMGAVRVRLGEVPSSSIRSYLNLNTPTRFERLCRGRYCLREHVGEYKGEFVDRPIFPSETLGGARAFNADCFEWLAVQAERSIHAIVTDPPYGLVEYTEKETIKLRNGKGGIWRIPPAFDGHQRAPLPRFTVLDEADKVRLYKFFMKFGVLAKRILVPGGNVVIASNPLLSHIVSSAMVEAGFELRGYLARQVMTMRGGDRPKNAHEEFSDVSVMPRSQWEPWVVLRAPLEGRVQDNLRKWRTGGFRRISADRPFGDLIRSHPTPSSEKKIAPHPSLKPQSFMRHLVRAVLPLGDGIIVDPFMGAGSTLAAANAVGYRSIGVELDEIFFDMAKSAIPLLANLKVRNDD
ncbi:DNA-methyltransferase [Pollutimonas bauzanensis]|uniref:Methyltransferase n=1 Tax=Pollutimonas bauzanensis TaxID=658167 RepID=A0A1M6A3D1_9BURK|nr:DNA methyltransferase [Pollutimonas bauzanensis]SHI30970.1 site-specific DNA-methyltransferase (adenine-specific) [Pollutimonas bauzanensis]